jgi:N-ethylmaleimide reductase
MSTIVAAETTSQQTQAERLSQPFQLGPYNLRHRMLMAHLTRSRSRQPGNIPSAMNACPYQQRASAALIISEATQISQQGQGYVDQVEGWRGPLILAGGFSHEIAEAWL